MSGHILNILANDLYRAENGIGALATICTGPLGVLLFGFVIYMETGFSGIVGILFMLVFVPIQSEWFFYIDRLIRLYLKYFPFGSVACQ